MCVAGRLSSVARSARQREGLYCYIITTLSAGFVNESAKPLCEAKSDRRHLLAVSCCNRTVDIAAPVN